MVPVGGGTDSKEEEIEAEDTGRMEHVEGEQGEEGSSASEEEEGEEDVVEEYVFDQDVDVSMGSEEEEEEYVPS